MPFFKDIWQGVTRPEKQSDFMTQFAQQLMMGGGSKGPLARLGNKLVGGLLHGGQRGAGRRQAQETADQRKAALSMLRPGVETMQAQRPGAGVLQRTDILPTDPSILTEALPAGGGVLSPEFAPMSEGEKTKREFMKSYRLKDKDPWGFIDAVMGSPELSKDPAMMSMVGQTYKDATKGWEAITSPTGGIFMWDGKNPNSMRQMTGGKPPAPVTKVADGVLYERDPATGEWVAQTTKDPGDNYKWASRDETKVVDGKKWKRKIDYRFDKSKGGDQPLEEIAHPWSLSVNQNIEGDISNQSKKLQEFVQQKIWATEDARIRSKAIEEQVMDPEIGERMLSYMTVPGRVEFGWDKVKDYMNWMDDPEDRAAYEQYTTLVRDVQENMNLYIKEITGAQMSEAEAHRLVKAIMTPGDGPIQFMSKLNGVLRSSERVLEAYEGRLSRSGSVEAAERAAQAELRRMLKEDPLELAKYGQEERAEEERVQGGWQ